MGTVIALWGLPNLPALRDTWVPSLSWEAPLEEVMAPHSSILAWRIPMDRGAWRAAVHGVTKNGTGVSDYMMMVRGLPWWSEGEDSIPPMQGLWVQPLLRELRSQVPCGLAKK